MPFYPPAAAAAPAALQALLPSLSCPSGSLCRSAEARDTAGLQQLLGLLAAEGFSLPFPAEDAPQHLAEITVIEREGKVGGGLRHL